MLPIALLNALTQIDHVVTLTQGGPDDSTNLLLFYIYQQAVQNNDSGLAAAATVISVAALLALDGAGETIETIVEMRSFDQAGLFDALAQRGANEMGRFRRKLAPCQRGDLAG